MKTVARHMVCLVLGSVFFVHTSKAQTLGVFYAYPSDIGYDGEYVHLFNNYFGPGVYVSMLNHPKHEYGDYYEPFEGDEYLSSYEHENRYGWSFGLNQRIATGFYVYAGYTHAYFQTLRTDYYYNNSEYDWGESRLYEVTSDSHKTRHGLDVGITITYYSAGLNVGYNFPLRTWSLGIGYCF